MTNSPILPTDAIIALIADDDTRYADTRELIIDRDSADLESDDLDFLDMMRTRIDDLSRDDLTDLALRFSLCPLHFCDYAICFDDDDDECAAIRTIHPSHDY